MNIKSSILICMLANCFLTTPLLAAPFLESNTQDHAARVAKNNAWIEIDVSTLGRNIDTLKAMLDANTKICAIIKADAYGNSVDLVMPTLIKANIPCLGFASNEEARIARKHGYTGTLMRVRTALGTEIRDAVQYNVEELVGNLGNAQEIAQIAKIAKHPIAVHIGINANGLSRNGLELASTRGQQDALAITKIKNLHIVGLMTHYPEEDKDSVRTNLALFNAQSAWLMKTAKLDRSKLILHTGNTFATIGVPEARLDMVRVGGAIYGDVFSCSPDQATSADVPSYSFERTFFAFKTRVAAVNSYPKGNTEPLL